MSDEPPENDFGDQGRLLRLDAETLERATLRPILTDLALKLIIIGIDVLVIAAAVLTLFQLSSPLLQGAVCGAAIYQCGHSISKTWKL